MRLRVVFAALLITLSLFLAWHSNQDFVYISLDKKWLYPLCYLMPLGAFTASIDGFFVLIFTKIIDILRFHPKSYHV